MTDETQTYAEPAAVAQDEPAVTEAPEAATEPEAAPEPAEAASEPAPAEPEAAAVVDEPEALRTDGPTLQEYVEAGYSAEGYPPTGYAVRDEPDYLPAPPAPEPVNHNALRGVQSGPPPHPRTG